MATEQLTGRAVSVDLHRHFESMASPVHVWVVDSDEETPQILDDAEGIFRAIERSCTRFDPNSALMRANRAGVEWCRVPPECFDVIEAAAVAHVVTRGRFDPRVLRVLEAQGYDRTLPFQSGRVSITAPRGLTPGPGREDARALPWVPGLDRSHSRVSIGSEPIDLGGIGKGFAVARAADVLKSAGTAALVEAGGDCAAVGAGPEGTGWMLAVEDPKGGDPIAVLRLGDAGCATSSTRLLRWEVDGRPVHHLIDPSTGEPGGQGLLAVTVIADDAARAEVWSKALFLSGCDGIGQLAGDLEITALWVLGSGRYEFSEPMERHVAWEVRNG